MGQEEVHIMIGNYTLIFTLSLFSPGTLSAPVHGEVHDTGDNIEAWHMKLAGWISPDEFLVIEIKHLNGPTYGMAGDYPPYEAMQEWDTLIDRLPDDRECPKMSFHARWRRLPDVLALDEHLRNYGGCRDVLRF
jgi:hypothetical protein